MREKFESICDYTTMRMIKRPEQMQGVTYFDRLYGDEGLDREVEALPRAIACLEHALRPSDERPNRQLGELQSFKYIAAGVCLR